MFRLADATPIATGHVREVYQHPDDETLLVKVIASASIEARWNQAPWYRRLARCGPYKDFVREFREYVTSIYVGDYATSPIARVVGLEMTDIGLGQVVEKVRTPDGKLAPTLHDWVKAEGFTEHTRAEMAAFYQRLLDHDTIAADLHAWNVVYGEDSRGGPRLVMIDGFGEKNIIPHQSMSRSHNAARVKRKYERMLKRTMAEAPGR
ncbi:YrbL family protein [Luteibacter yeojuensis]|uniref:PhoP regulatory network protein YrbL n=1 Tax=Luteibacter yeojuensis TaxID=345309 RepID=A0A0F3KXZ2_9GAMM|nr:YrbL family protein [Luteibacter yeojuensis]KJV35832.1 hypothetical protein VI08_07610 [Luteibacter yeojuensis]